MDEEPTPPGQHPGYPPIGPGRGPGGAGPHNPFPDLHGHVPRDEPDGRESDAELQRRIAMPTCLFCGHHSFQEEIAKMPTRFGWEAHKSRLLICQRCGFMMNFSMGRGINFD